MEKAYSATQSVHKRLGTAVRQRRDTIVIGSNGMNAYVHGVEVFKYTVASSISAVI